MGRTHRVAGTARSWSVGRYHWLGLLKGPGISIFPFPLLRSRFRLLRHVALSIILRITEQRRLSRLHIQRVETLPLARFSDFQNLKIQTSILCTCKACLVDVWLMISYKMVSHVKMTFPTGSNHTQKHVYVRATVSSSARDHPIFSRRPHISCSPSMFYRCCVGNRVHWRNGQFIKHISGASRI